jgi:TRAP transporter TAXI family solute receptor
MIPSDPGCSANVRQSGITRSNGSTWFARLIIAAILLIPGAVVLPWSPHSGAAAAQTIVRIATAPPGRLMHTYGLGVSEILNKHSTLITRILPVGLSPTYLPMMERKEVEFAFISGDEAARIYYGTGEFKELSGGKGFDVLYALNGGLFVTSFVVRKSSDIQKIADLKGKPIPVGYAAAPYFDYWQRALLANAGLTYADIIPVPVSEIARVRDLFTAGRVATVGTWAPGIPQMIEMDFAIGVRYLPVDSSPEAVKRMAEVGKGMFVVPPGRYAGVTGVGQDTPLVAIHYGLMVHAGTSDQTVYEVVKALYEHNEELKKFHLTLGDWERETFVSDRATVPYHPGAIKFYQEKGIWTPAMAELNRQLQRK